MHTRAPRRSVPQGTEPRTQSFGIANTIDTHTHTSDVEGKPVRSTQRYGFLCHLPVTPVPVFTHTYIHTHTRTHAAPTLRHARGVTPRSRSSAQFVRSGTMTASCRYCYDQPPAERAVRTDERTRIEAHTHTNTKTNGMLLIRVRGVVMTWPDRHPRTRRSR